MCVYCNIRKSAMNRHRKRLFGDESLEAYTVTPEAGEMLEATFAIDWFAHRVRPTTDGGTSKEAGAWQFQISANDDWETSQAFILRLATLIVGTRRWKTAKVEKPIGQSKVFKVKAQIQSVKKQIGD